MHVRHQIVDAVPRMAPAITTDTAAFWTGGSDGQLLILRCASCGYYMHPPFPVCRQCKSFDVRPEAVSGHGAVYTYSINRHPWSDPSEPPYVVAVVELIEQPELFVTSNIVGCDVDAVFIGMQVEVDFIESGDAWIPVFWPSAPEAALR